MFVDASLGFRADSFEAYRKAGIEADREYQLVLCSVLYTDLEVHQWDPPVFRYALSNIAGEILMGALTPPGCSTTPKEGGSTWQWYPIPVPPKIADGWPIPARNTCSVKWWSITANPAPSPSFLNSGFSGAGRPGQRHPHGPRD